MAAKIIQIGLKRNKIDHLPRLYKGSLWFTLSHSAIDYILKYLNQNPDYLTPFKTSLCGDEVFFHTIMFNSHFYQKLKPKITCTRVSHVILIGSLVLISPVLLMKRF